MRSSGQLVNLPEGKLGRFGHQTRVGPDLDGVERDLRVGTRFEGHLFTRIKTQKHIGLNFFPLIISDFVNHTFRHYYIFTNLVEH